MSEQESHLKNIISAVYVGQKPIPERVLTKKLAAVTLGTVALIGVFVAPAQAQSRFFADSRDSSSVIYENNQTMRPANVEEGRVVAIRQVEVRNDGNNAGTLVGGMTGGMVGYAVARHAHGGMSVLGAVAGSLIGGIVGNRIEERTGSHQAMQVFVEVNQYGRRHVLATVQDSRPDIYPGANVLVTSGMGGLRVIPANQQTIRQIGQDSQYEQPQYSQPQYNDQTRFSQPSQSQSDQYSPVQEQSGQDQSGYSYPDGGTPRPRGW